MPIDPDTLQFRLTITCENAAFEDDPARTIARILRSLATRMDPLCDTELFDTTVTLRDTNGNECGHAALKTAYEHENARRSSWRSRRGVAALFLGAFLALSAWSCGPAPDCPVQPADAIMVAQYPDGSFSVDVYADGVLESTAHLPADALMADAFPTKGAPQ